MASRVATVLPGTRALARHQRAPALRLETIRDLGGVTRADLSRLTGLSRSAVAHAVAALLADGLIGGREPGGGHAGQRGRPATLLTPSRPPGHVVGIDFGHAHVGVAIADTAGEVLAESRQGADVDHDADEVLDTSARMTRDLLSQAGVPLGQVIAVVAGLPGPVDPRTRALRPPAIPAGWAGRAAGSPGSASPGRRAGPDGR